MAKIYCVCNYRINYSHPCHVCWWYTICIILVNLLGTKGACNLALASIFRLSVRQSASPCS